MNWKIWGFWSGLIVLEAIADIFAKYYALSPTAVFFGLALLFYILANSSWLISLRLGMKLWQGVVLFGVAQAVTGVIIGLFMGETITVIQGVGIGIALLSIILIGG